MGIMTDCIAYNREEICCDALKNLYCVNEERKFYKTEKQFKSEREKCVRRLRKIRFYAKGENK